MGVNKFELAERVALAVRKQLEDDGVIKKFNDKSEADEGTDNLALTYDELEKAIVRFNGRIVKNDSGNDDYVKKTADDAFVIFTKFFKDESGEEEQPESYFNVLHEFGHVFLDLFREGVQVGTMYPCSGRTESDAAAWLFARTFAMPRRNFEAAIFKHGFDAVAIANAFNIDYVPVMTRGRELKIWK